MVSLGMLLENRCPIPTPGSTRTKKRDETPSVSCFFRHTMCRIPREDCEVPSPLGFVAAHSQTSARMEGVAVVLRVSEFPGETPSLSLAVHNQPNFRPATNPCSAVSPFRRCRQMTEEL